MEDDPVAVLLEDLRDQFKVFGEALDGTRQELKADIGDLKSDVAKVDTRLMRVESRLGSVESSVASLDKRMHRVEDHLGLNGVAPKKKPRPSTKPRKK